MSKQSPKGQQGGVGMVVVVAAVAFVLGKCSGSPTPELNAEASASYAFAEPVESADPMSQIMAAPITKPSTRAPLTFFGSSDDTYYANCSEARVAGAAPVYENEAGYAGHLDRDGDGIGCE